MNNEVLNDAAMKDAQPVSEPMVETPPEPLVAAVPVVEAPVAATDDRGSGAWTTAVCISIVNCRSCSSTSGYWSRRWTVIPTVGNGSEFLLIFSADLDEFFKVCSGPEEADYLCP